VLIIKADVLIIKADALFINAGRLFKKIEAVIINTMQLFSN
jgi:hypothetical protein